LKTFADELFSSLCDLAKYTNLSKTIIHWHLIDSFGFIIRHLRWIPHRLSNNHKANRYGWSTQLYGLFEKQQIRAWHDIITLDKSWFHFSAKHELIWFAPEEVVPEREQHIIQSPKLMITVVWNTKRFHVIEAPSKCTEFNASYYITEILEWIKE
jgi:hypothetical protein